MTEMEVSSSLEGRKYTRPTRCSAEGASGVVRVKFNLRSRNFDEYRDILDAKGAGPLLGNDLYRACKGIGVQQQGIGELTDKRAAAKGSDMSSILTMMMRLAILVDKADVIAFCLGRGAVLDNLHMDAVADYEAFASHKVMIEAKAVGIDHRIRWTGNFLCVAVRRKNLKWAEFCLEKGAGPNSMVDGIKPVIALAAEQGFQAMVELLLDFDAELRGSGAIVLAAAAGRTEMVRLLLEKGADVNERLHPIRDVGTPLHRAITNGRIETAKLLIKAGANLALGDHLGRTPRLLAEQLL